MVCANEVVESAGLRLASPTALQQAPRCIREALDPRWQLALLNTADALHPEWQQAVLGAAGEQGAHGDGGNGKLNRGEAYLALALLRSAVVAGVEQRRMGVIAPFNAQVMQLQLQLQLRLLAMPSFMLLNIICPPILLQCELIKRMCRDAGLADVEVRNVKHAASAVSSGAPATPIPHAHCTHPSVTAAPQVLTVDKCQGRDKDMMILSFTACNNSREPRACWLMGVAAAWMDGCT